MNEYSIESTVILAERTSSSFTSHRTIGVTEKRKSEREIHIDAQHLHAETPQSQLNQKRARANAKFLYKK